MDYDCKFLLLKEITIEEYESHNSNFRHDNPSLHEAVRTKDAKFLPIFIFDGECAGTMFKCYNRYSKIHKDKFITLIR